MGVTEQPTTVTPDHPETQNETACKTPGKPIRQDSKKVRTHGVGVWGGRRIVAGFRCDESLWKRFVSEFVPIYGSTCKVMESILVSLMDPVQKLRENGQNGLTPGSTSRDNSVPVLHVENLHIHRNLSREKRNLGAGEILPVETRLNEAVDASYERFRGSKHFPSYRDVLDYVRVEWGLVGLDGKSVVENVMGRIREDRRKTREDSP